MLPPFSFIITSIEVLSFFFFSFLLSFFVVPSLYFVFFSLHQSVLCLHDRTAGLFFLSVLRPRLFEGCVGGGEPRRGARLLDEPALERGVVAEVGVHDLQGDATLLSGIKAGQQRGAQQACGQILARAHLLISAAHWLRAWLPDWVAARVDLGGAHESPAPADPLLPAPLAG